jgi:hypothetical protein
VKGSWAGVCSSLSWPALGNHKNAGFIFDQAVCERQPAELVIGAGQHCVQQHSGFRKALVGRDLLELLDDGATAVVEFLDAFAEIGIVCHVLEFLEEPVGFEARNPFGDSASLGNGGAEFLPVFRSQMDGFAIEVQHSVLDSRGDGAISLR